MSSALLVKPAGAMLATSGNPGKSKRSSERSESPEASSNQLQVEQVEKQATQREGSELRVKYVKMDEIVRRILPLMRIEEAELRQMLAKYDTEKLGGLTHDQWVSFCTHYQSYFTMLGEKLISFDRLGEYTVIFREKVNEDRRERRTFVQEGIRFLEGFAAGGIAGAVSKTVIAPGDRIKIIFQVNSSMKFSLKEAFMLSMETVRQHGVHALWTGNGATMMRVVPYAAITYVSFDYYYALSKKFIGTKRDDGTEDEMRAVTLRFLSGAFAGATSTALTYPLDLMRARFAARSHKGPIPSYRVAYKHLISTHGWMSLYSGLVPTIVGIMPYAGCSFACFETMKHYIVAVEGLKSQKEIPTYQRLIAGGLSGLMAQSVTYPLDIVRRRMQVSPGRYRGITDALRTIRREEGLRQGLYKGLAMNWIKGPIAVATSFTVNDVLKTRIEAYYQSATLYSDRQNIVTIPEALVCGGVAAGVAKLWTLPFSRLKIMYQVGMTNSLTEATGKRGIASLRGAFSSGMNPWQSSGIMMMRVIPYGALTYCFFDVFQAVSQRLLYSHKPTLETNFVAGASAAAMSTLIVYPLDLLRTRAAASMHPTSMTLYWTFLDLVKRRGFRSTYEGCSIAILGICPLAGIGFASYEGLKKHFECETFGERLLAGGVSGLLGQAVTFPFNVVKRQRQVEQVAYSSLGDIKSLFLKPGFYTSLYRKMPLSWTLGAMTFGFSFAVNDFCRDSVVQAKKDMIADLV